jgi:hypothetical protein
MVTDEGDDKRGTRELVEADRGAGGGLGQRERRCGGAEGEHSGLGGHARQSRSTTPAGHHRRVRVRWVLAENLIRDKCSIAMFGTQNCQISGATFEAGTTAGFQTC